MMTNKRKAAKKVRLPEFSGELEETVFSKCSDTRSEEKLFQNEEIANIPGKEFYECIFRNVKITGKADHTLFVDVLFDHCDLSNLDLNTSVFRRVQMKHCRMTGTELSDCTFHDLTLEETMADYTNWSGSKWKNCSVKAVNLRECALTMCTFDNVYLEQNQLEESECYNTSFAGIDLSTSVIDGMKVSENTLRGATLNKEQFVACADLFGIHIKE